jgi:hypothetical protein
MEKFLRLFRLRSICILLSDDSGWLVDASDTYIPQNSDG